MDSELRVLECRRTHPARHRLSGVLGEVHPLRAGLFEEPSSVLRVGGSANDTSRDDSGGLTTSMTHSTPRRRFDSSANLGT